MKIQTPFIVLPKYFNDFNNYFNNSKKELVSYTYIPEYLRKSTEKNSEALIKSLIYLNPLASSSKQIKRCEKINW